MYKNIIFDVGEVMFSYRWVEALAMGGISLEEAKVVGPKAFYDPLWTELDLGIRPYFDVVSDLSKAYPEYSEAITNFLTNVENMPLDRPRVWEKVHELK